MFGTVMKKKELTQMDDILVIFEKISKSLTWPFIGLVFLILTRKSLNNIVSSFSTIVERIKKVDVANTVSFEIYEKQKEIIKDQANTIEALSKQDVGGKSATDLDNLTLINLDNNLEKLNPIAREKMAGVLSEFKDNINSEFDNKENDPLKRKFGEKSETDRAILKALVSNLPNNLYKINIEVISKYNESPLTGYVNFHLHPTFKPDVRSVKVENGTAKLTLISYGSFTIGAECEGKQMELDLAEIPGVSEQFKNT